MAGLHEAGALLLAHGKTHIWQHSQAVATESLRLAGLFGVDSKACETAALCHDIGGILQPADMLARAKTRGFVIDPAEEKYPFLLHQRFSGLFCREMLGIENEAVLSAVECHTTLKPFAGPVDMVVFLADKIAWDQTGEPPYLVEVQRALKHSLAAGCLAYMEYAMEHGMILMPHGWLLAARQWLRAVCK